MAGWSEIVLQGSQALLSLLVEEVRRPPNRPPDAGDVTQPHVVDDGCPACRLHRDLAEARGLADNLALAAQDNGGRPPRHVAHTAWLIRQCLEDARSRAETIATGRPDLQDHVSSLDARIEVALMRIPLDEIDQDQANLLAAAVHDCWDVGRQLANTYFEPKGPRSRLRAWVEALPSDKRTELLEILEET
jgi:hypothetical protein